MSRPVLLLVAVLGVLWLQAEARRWRAAQRAEAAEAAENRVRDSLAIERVAAAAADSGWAVRFADTTAALGDRLEAARGEAGRIAGELRAARARVAGYVELATVLEDSLVSVATARDTASAVPEWWDGRLEDDVLTGRWRFERGPEELSLAYSARCPGELVTAAAGDGRWLVAARGLHPDCRLELGEVSIEPPPPLEVEVCPFGARLRWGLGIAGAIELGAALFR